MSRQVSRFPIQYESDEFCLNGLEAWTVQAHKHAYNLLDDVQRPDPKGEIHFISESYRLEKFHPLRGKIDVVRAIPVSGL
jgi:hypothetical protein